MVLLGQVPGDGVRTGVQPLLGQLAAQLDDQLDGRRRDRRRLAVRPAGPSLERRLTLAAVTGEQLVDPLPRHTVGDGYLRNRAAFDNDSSDHQAGFRHPASQTRLCRLCLATSVAYVMKQDTAATASRTTPPLWSPETGDIGMHLPGPLVPGEPGRPESATAAGCVVCS